MSPDIRTWWIYKITSPIGRVYIGKSCNIKNRLSAYKATSKGCIRQPLVYNSLLQYGPDNHKFEIIDTFFSDNDFASGKEIFWIRSYMSNESKWRAGIGLNLSDGGEGVLGVKFPNRVSSNKGVKYSDERRKSMSERAKANPSMGMLGKKHTQSAKDNMSLNKKGKAALHRLGVPLSEETKKKLSLAHKGRPSLNKGKKIWSEEEKISIGLSKIGNKYMLGKHHTNENCEKFREYGFNRQGKYILQYDLNGNFIAEYKGVRKASLETGICRKTITNGANGVTLNPTSFIFKYKKQ